MAQPQHGEATTGSQRDTSGLLAQLPIWSRYSRPLRVTFPAAGTKRDVAHTLGVIPDGWITVWADAVIGATPGVLWTPTTAYLQASPSNAHAILIFYTLREVPADA